jgi:hypothetical protein
MVCVIKWRVKALEVVCLPATPATTATANNPYISAK